MWLFTRKWLVIVVAISGAVDAEDLALPDLAPWYSKQLEIKPTAAYFFRSSKMISSGAKCFRRSLDGHFCKVSTSVPVFRWCGEIDLLACDTSMRAFGIDTFALSVRYNLLDDTPLEAPVSIVVGSTLRFASKAALNDLNSFHHGRLESLLHIACGKEWSHEEFWTFRASTLGLIGISDVGSPWCLACATLDKNWYDSSQISASLSYMHGFGGERLAEGNKFMKGFHGYGPVKHRSVDASIRYMHTSVEGLSFSAQYTYTLYSYNMPKNVNYFGVAVIYPFGL